MRNISLTSLLVIAALMISMTIRSESSAQIQLPPPPDTFYQGAGGQGFGAYPPVPNQIGRGGGSSSRALRAPAARPQQPPQQQQQGPPEAERLTTRNVNDGNVIHAGDQPGDYPMPTTEQRPLSIGDQEGDYPMPTNEQRPMSIGDQEGDYPMPTNEQRPMSIGDQEGDYDMPTTPQRPMAGGAGTEAQNSCESAGKTAKSACLMPGTDGMDSGTAAMYTMMMTAQLPAMATQIATIGKNMAQQCKVQADVAKIMTAINGIKGTACATMISTCKARCGEEAKFARSEKIRYDGLASTNPSAMELSRKEAEKERVANREASTCGAYQGQVMAMMFSAMQSGVQIVANKQCEEDLSAFNTTTPAYTPPPIAAIGGCEDPNNQTMACYCSRPGNSASAMCAGFSSGGIANGGGAATTPNGSTVATPYTSTVAGLDDGNTLDPFANPAQKGGGGGGGGPGDGGSGAPGGGGIASFSSEGGGGSYGGDPKSAITGTSGGTGSGLGGSGGGGGGGGLARNNNGQSGAGNKGFFDKFNLKKFLPTSKYKTRGIAGMSVKSVDGITGPMGPSLFEKATRQYQEQIQKQSVILDK